MTLLAGSADETVRESQTVSESLYSSTIQEDINTTVVVQMAVLSDHFQEILTEYS